MFSGIIETRGEIVATYNKHNGRVLNIAYKKNPSEKELPVTNIPVTNVPITNIPVTKKPASATKNYSNASHHKEAITSTTSPPHNKRAIAITKIGASIAINGVCTTVTEFDPTTFTCFVSNQTLEITNLKTLKKGTIVNLESSLTYGAKVDGHLIYGHIDDTIALKNKIDLKDTWILQFAIKPKHNRYLILKGPVALNGISLTIYNITCDLLEVMIIPHTYFHTNLQFLTENEEVNIEFDTLPKYIEKLLPQQT
ncbi:riboflavin synthase [Spirochaetota bacterium]|nr:riboflavin synthase [Spirochaetota bacterium]